jgi:inward rectifier potassium channel
MTAFEFRIINERSNQLIEVEAKVMFSRLETHDGKRVRRFDLLPLERSKVAFFPIQWVVVHPIDESSPLRGLSREDLAASNAEFFILLTAIDETFAQTVHARSSYRFDEVVAGAKFADMYRKTGDSTRVDMRRFHEIEDAPLPGL